MVAPLEGIRVVDMSQVLAAPGATAFMADLGADVIKVEPPGGEGMRNSNTAATLGIEVESEINCIFELNNRGKRSIVLNLDSEAGRKLLHKLCESADLFITNMLPASRKRRNLTEGDLWKTNPKLVYCVLSGYGSDGPQADRPAIGQTAFWAGAAIMGLCSDPPNIPSIGIDDYAVTLNVFGSAMVGLRQRDKTGKGQYVEVSLQGTGIWTNAYPISVGLVAKQQAAGPQPRAAEIGAQQHLSDQGWALGPADRRPRSVLGTALSRAWVRGVDRRSPIRHPGCPDRECEGACNPGGGAVRARGSCLLDGASQRRGSYLEPGDDDPRSGGGCPAARQWCLQRRQPPDRGSV